MENKKIRVDQALVHQGLVKSRKRAQALIMARKVFCDSVRLDKPGTLVDAETPLRLRESDHPWVSRGGIKLAHALDHFHIKPKGLICADIGASTGGFTDVLITREAERVYAVDVGHGQLDWRLRKNADVVVLERTNARYISNADIPDAIDLITCDVSFIGLEKLLPASLALSTKNAYLIALIKPQFEVARHQVGKGGIVRNEELQHEVCSRICNWINSLSGWLVKGVVKSPISGTKGNKEFLIAAHRTPE